MTGESTNASDLLQCTPVFRRQRCVLHFLLRRAVLPRIRRRLPTRCVIYAPLLFKRTPKLLKSDGLLRVRHQALILRILKNINIT